MALIVEDGSVVDGADSFTSLEDARTNASNRGLELSDVDDTARAQLRQGYSWLVHTYEERTQGSRVSSVQTGIFPRIGVVARGFDVPSDSVPTDLIDAQVSMAASINSGVDTNATQTGSDLASFNVDGVYSESYKDGGSYTLANTPAITRMLTPYFKSGGKISLSREDMRLTNGWC